MAFLMGTVGSRLCQGWRVGGKEVGGDHFIRGRKEERRVKTLPQITDLVGDSAGSQVHSLCHQALRYSLQGASLRSSHIPEYLGERGQPKYGPKFSDALLVSLPMLFAPLAQHQAGSRREQSVGLPSALTSLPYSLFDIGVFHFF